MMQGNWVDLAIISIIGLSVLTGLVRGFIKELVALIIWLVAIWVAYHYTAILDPSLQKYIQDKSIRAVISFILLLLGVVILGGLFNSFLGFILKSSGLSGIDRLLGMIFGFVRGIFIIALSMVIVKMTSMPYENYARNSQLYLRFDPVVNWLSGWVPQLINHAKALDNTFINNKTVIDIPDIKKTVNDRANKERQHPAEMSDVLIDD